MVSFILSGYARLHNQQPTGPEGPGVTIMADLIRYQYQMLTVVDDYVDFQISSDVWGATKDDEHFMISLVTPNCVIDNQPEAHNMEEI